MWYALGILLIIGLLVTIYAIATAPEMEDDEDDGC